MNKAQDDKDEPAVSMYEVLSKTFTKEHVANAKAPKQEHAWSMQEQGNTVAGGTVV